MRVNKPLDLSLLVTEFEQAGVMPPYGLSTSGIYPGTEYEQDIWTTDADHTPHVELPPECEAIIAAHDHTKPKRVTLFEQQEDAERLALINDRAQIDPAFAALSEITLRPR